MGPYGKQGMFHISELNVDETNNTELCLVIYTSVKCYKKLVLCIIY